ncbi:MAG TPA: radical SAM family heme chaperone HemW [Clostridia bacterium]
MEKKEIGVYIHVPFCRAKCSYCDFNSYPGKENLAQQYFDALKKEIALSAEALKGLTIKSVFIGGGTPSLVKTEFIYEVLNELDRFTSIDSKAEISIETNPGTLTYDKLYAYKSMGINRLSVGLQSADNELLLKLGRIHSVEEFYNNYRLALKAGFDNINIDLIFGIPGQTFENWTNTLNSVIQINPSHLSCYSLKIEEDTVFGKMLDAGDIKPIEDEKDREMYHETIRILGDSGYRHYEISNFARDGYECRHNLIYWNAEEYIGYGAGAHSYFMGIRYNNEYSVEKYIEKIYKDQNIRENESYIDMNESMSEYMLLGLRLIDGVSLERFRERFNQDIPDAFKDSINMLSKKGLLTSDWGIVKLTSKGLDLANEVFMEFV